MPHPDDELLSALLDGEAPSGDVAHAEGCATCQSRLEELRLAAAFVARAVTPQPGHLREASLAVAMRTADEPLRVAAVTSLGRRLPNRTAARAGANRRANALSAAAALVVALAVAGLAISQLTRGNGTDATNSRDAIANAALAPSTEDAAGSAAGTVGKESQLSAGSGGAHNGPYEAGDLGAVNDISVLVNRANTDLAQSPELQAQHVFSEPSPCPYETGGSSLWQATLTYNAEPAVAHVVEIDSGRVMQILRRAGCALLASQAFESTSPR